MLKARNILIFFLVLFLWQITAQDKVFTTHDIFRIQNVGNASVSPDGNFALYTLSVPRPFSDKAGSDYSNLHIYDFTKNESKELITGKLNIYSPSWDIDSKSIFFRAKLEQSPKTQVYEIELESKEIKLVTNSDNSVSQYELSPDGKHILYTSEEVLSSNNGLAEKGFNQEIFEENLADRNLYTLNLENNEVKQLTKDVSVFDFIWSNNGKHIAAAIAPNNLVDDSYMFKRIHLIDLESGEIKKIVNNPGKLGEMSFSPDDSKLAFISAADTNDSVAGSIFIADTKSENSFEKLKNYSKGFRGSATDIDWIDNSTFLFLAEEGVYTVISRQKIDQEEREILLEENKVILSSFSFNGDKFVFAGNTKIHPNELFVFDHNSKNLSKLTNHNSWLEDYKLSKQEKIVYYAKDGLDIEAVLIYPLNYEEGKSYPLITYIHGGPESAEMDGWQTSYSRWGQVAAAKDYFVFIPNYRASAGRGYEFALMGLGDLAGKEFEDVIDGVDFLISKGWIDHKKVGIGGGSYGGYFSAWAATRHSERFAASVCFVGIGNQISKRNTTDIPWEDYYVHWGIWTNEDLEKIYDRSPVKWAHLNQTPLLILHGTADPRVHPSQSLELYRSVKMFGKAPVRLVWYPDQGHGNSKNTAKLDYALRTMEWFDYYLKGDNDKSTKPNTDLDYNLEILD